MRHLRVLAWVILVALVAAACGDDGLVADDGPSPPGSPDGAWVLTAGTVDGEPLPLLDEHRVTLTIDGTTVTGRAACNGYGGTIAVDGGSVTVTDLSWTEMACLPEVMAIESAFLSALPDVTDATWSATTATLRGQDADFTFARLDPVPVTELVDTRWKLRSVIDGDTARSVVEGSDPPSLLLSSDGTLVGGTGCRQLSGEYVVSGDTVQVTSLAADGECPDDLRAQDDDVISRLEGGFRVEIDGTRLTVTSDGGEALHYVAG